MPFSEIHVVTVEVMLASKMVGFLLGGWAVEGEG
jgi:hypothetical protein